MEKVLMECPSLQGFKGGARAQWWPGQGWVSLLSKGLSSPNNSMILQGCWGILGFCDVWNHPGSFWCCAGGCGARGAQLQSWGSPSKTNPSFCVKKEKYGGKK